MVAERAGYTVTMFVVDVSPSMGKKRTIELPPDEKGKPPLDGIIVAIQTQDEYLGKKASWTRKLVLVTDAENPLNVDDSDGWEGTAQKLNDLHIETKIIGVDFDYEDFHEKNKSALKSENEKFYHQLSESLDNCLIGSCAQALQDCAYPDVKTVKPAVRSTIFRIGDTEVLHEEAIEFSAVVVKVTAKAYSVGLKRFAKREGSRRDHDGDHVMDEGPKRPPTYAPLERRTEHFVKLQNSAQEEPVKQELDEDDDEDPQKQRGEHVDQEDLVPAYRYGSSYVPIQGGFDKFPTKVGIEVLGFLHASKFNRSFLMSEMYWLGPDPKSAKSQVSLSSFVRAMNIKDVYAIVRWVHQNDADAKMAICYPVVDKDTDYLFMARVPFAEDFRKYTFPSLDNLYNKKGEKIEKHPLLPTDAVQTAMDKWVDKMDLMDAAVNEEGDPCPWFDINDSFHPSIHRLKQALAHAAVVPDISEHPVPPPHPELTKYFETPSEVLERSQKALQKLKSVADVKIVPPKSVAKKKKGILDATEHIGPEFSVENLLGESEEADEETNSGPLGQPSSVSAKSKEKKMDLDGDLSATDEEEQAPAAAKAKHRGPPLPTPALSPPKGKGKKKESRPVKDKDIRPGRIIGNADPLEDFRENLSRGDVVSKALEDMGDVIMEIVAESFSSQRYDEAIECMKAMRQTALEEDDVEIWNGFLQEFKKKCRNRSFKNRDFWERVKAIGRKISLISDNEADEHDGYSTFTERQVAQFINES
ncbi:ATP-dependent DNA helicase II subunit 2 [Tulasnella sp. 419]|nr:ATP-dependent DNA helicase II subunit 2 [Tulasnella sp. 419]